MSESEDDKPDENEVLRRMLAMPPKPHEFGEGKRDDGKPKPAAKVSSRKSK